MLAISYTQDLNPLGNVFLSTFIAGIPILVLFYLLVMRGWLASKAGAAAACSAIVLAWLFFHMPLKMASIAFFHGAIFGLLPTGWTVFSAMFVYNITVVTGQFNVIRRSVASLSGDARIQAIIIGFAFGAFLEGAAGAGSPVAICGAMLVGLGFPPLRAAVICLIANTSPVAYGGLGVPLMTLSAVSDIPGDSLSIMAGHQLPILSCLIPIYMVKIMGKWKQVFEIWPALVVAGGSFALFQLLFATIHAYIPTIVIWPLTDVGGGIFALVVTAIFLKFWQPKQELHYNSGVLEYQNPLDRVADKLTFKMVAKAWTPFAIMSIFLMLTGVLRQEENRRVKALEGPKTVQIWDNLQTRYDISIEGLDREVMRAERLRKVLPNGELEDKPEDAIFSFVWVTAPGTPVMLSAIFSMIFLRIRFKQFLEALGKTAKQMKVPIPTIACMLGLSYVTRYAGMDAILGVALAGTGLFYPFFAAILGWLGVFLTGTDAGSNALFGSLQKITATEVFHGGAIQNLSLDQAQVLICTANSTGGVMGKMIDAQSICVATAGTNQVGKESTIFKSVFWHSILLATVVGLLTLLQAYVPPFTYVVPGIP